MSSSLYGMVKTILTPRSACCTAGHWGFPGSHTTGNVNAQSARSGAQIGKAPTHTRLSWEHGVAAAPRDVTPHCAGVGLMESAAACRRRRRAVVLPPDGDGGGGLPRVVTTTRALRRSGTYLAPPGPTRAAALRCVAASTAGGGSPPAAPRPARARRRPLRSGGRDASRWRCMPRTGWARTNSAAGLASGPSLSVLVVTRARLAGSSLVGSVPPRTPETRRTGTPRAARVGRGAMIVGESPVRPAGRPAVDGTPPTPAGASRQLCQWLGAHVARQQPLWGVPLPNPTRAEPTPHAQTDIPPDVGPRRPP